MEYKERTTEYLLQLNFGICAMKNCKPSYKRRREILLEISMVSRALLPVDGSHDSFLHSRTGHRRESSASSKFGHLPKGFVNWICEGKRGKSQFSCVSSSTKGIVSKCTHEEGTLLSWKGIDTEPIGNVVFGILNVDHRPRYFFQASWSSLWSLLWDC